jgi:hypothetical protein
MSKDGFPDTEFEFVKEINHEHRVEIEVEIGQATRKGVL